MAPSPASTAAALAYIKSIGADKKPMEKLAVLSPHGKQHVPPEIIFYIINLLLCDCDEKINKPTIICIGLTAHTYWDFIRSKYPMQMISPTSSCFRIVPGNPFLNQTEKNLLRPMLEEWVGPNYRPVSDTFLEHTSTHYLGCQIMFLGREVYGNIAKSTSVLKSKEKDLIDRLHFWKYWPVPEWTPGVPFRAPMLKTLPNPYGMGIEWYPTAARELRNMMCHWRGLRTGDPQTRWDYGHIIFWLGYRGSCLWQWVHKYHFRDAQK